MHTAETHAAWRSEVVEKLVAGRHRVYDDRGCIEGLEAFRLRAVERGFPVVAKANGGVSRLCSRPRDRDRTGQDRKLAGVKIQPAERLKSTQCRHLGRCDECQLSDWIVLKNSANHFGSQLSNRAEGYCATIVCNRLSQRTIVALVPIRSIRNGVFQHNPDKADLLDGRTTAVAIVPKRMAYTKRLNF